VIKEENAHEQLDLNNVAYDAKRPTQESEEGHLVAHLSQELHRNEGEDASERE
jgi:hypothetical protein